MISRLLSGGNEKTKGRKEKRERQKEKRNMKGKKRRQQPSHSQQLTLIPNHRLSTPLSL